EKQIGDEVSSAQAVPKDAEPALAPPQAPDLAAAPHGRGTAPPAPALPRRAGPYLGGRREGGALLGQVRGPYARPPAHDARTLALQQADVVFLMGARFNWILHFGLAPRYSPNVRVIQLDINPESMHQNKPAEVALLGDGKAIMQQLNQALAGRQWFHPQSSPWRQAISKKSEENAAMIKPQIDDDSSPGGYYRLFRDIREWLPKDVVLCSEGAGTMDIGGTMMPLENPRSYMNAGSYGTMGVGLGLVVAACVVHPDRPVVHVSGDSAIGFSGMEMETLCRYGMPAKIVVLNNGGI